MADYEPRIPKYPFRVVPGIIFGLTIITALARTIIRCRQNHRLLLDDIFLIFGCICLTSATVLFYLSLTPTYIVGMLNLDPVSGIVPPNSFRPFSYYQKLSYCSLDLLFAATFSFKASLLCFFRGLTDRIYWVRVYWKVVVGITACSFALCICSAFIACPYFDGSTSRCSPKNGLIIGYFSTISDIFTDLLITLLPVMILWRAKIKRSQKLRLATFLCLNVVMIIVVSVRLSGWRIPGTGVLDVVWGLFWVYMEACISVMTVSLIAFRSAFVIRSSRKKASQWYTPRNIWNRRKPSADNESDRLGNLPNIPSATLTGMRTLIRRTSNRESRIYETLGPDWSLSSDIASLPTEPSGNKLQERVKDDETLNNGWSLRQESLNDNSNANV